MGYLVFNLDLLKDGMMKMMTMHTIYTSAVGGPAVSGQRDLRVSPIEIRFMKLEGCRAGGAEFTKCIHLVTWVTDSHQPTYAPSLTAYELMIIDQPTLSDPFRIHILSHDPVMIPIIYRFSFKSLLIPLLYSLFFIYISL
jgi:hypothetical protein